MIAAMLRVKNEQRWIARVLASLSFCDRIFVFDDHSEDETRDICRQFPRLHVTESPFEGLNETRDKNLLLDRVELAVPAGTWIVSIDGDEELAPGSAAEIQRLAAEPGPYDSFRFQVLYLWDSEKQWRVDGIYSQFYRPSMFPLIPGQRFRSAAGGGFHCGNVPIHGKSSRTQVQLLHYGYLHRADRIRKYEWYNAPDKQPIPANEDGYRHMVIGDIFTADTRTVYAGPLELRPL